MPPLRGGMERLNLHLARGLASWADLTVVGPVGCRQFLPKECRVVEVPAAPVSSFLRHSFRAAWVASCQPMDFVMAGSGLTAVAAKVAALRSGARSIVYVHGLDLLVRNLLYKTFWLPTLRRFDQVIANSSNTAGIAVRMSVSAERINVIHPGVALPEENAGCCAAFREKYRLGGRPVLLSVGRLTARKGIEQFIRYALPLIRRQHPQVLLVVLGDEAADALTVTGRFGKAEIQKIAVDLGLQDNLCLLGPCDDETLSQAYFAADVHVFPVRDIPGDVEGFGMVAIEAAAHGLPTVAFAVGGVPDAVADKCSGYLVPPGHYDMFSERVCQLLDAREEKSMRDGCQRFAQEFSWDKFAVKVRQLLKL